MEEPMERDEETKQVAWKTMIAMMADWPSYMIADMARARWQIREERKRPHPKAEIAYLMSIGFLERNGRRETVEPEPPAAKIRLKPAPVATAPAIEGRHKRIVWKKGYSFGRRLACERLGISKAEWECWDSNGLLPPPSRLKEGRLPVWGEAKWVEFAEAIDRLREEHPVTDAAEREAQRLREKRARDARNRYAWKQRHRETLRAQQLQTA